MSLSDKTTREQALSQRSDSAEPLVAKEAEALPRRGCLFCRIVRGDISADILHRGEHVLAFADICPQAPVHVLVISKQHIGSIAQLTAQHGCLIGEVMLAAKQVAQDKGLEETGYRLVVNTGVDACQTVPHLHVHVIGGRALAWPPG